MKAKLSLLWLFTLLNYLYCDIVTIMDPEMLRQFISGSVGGMQITPGFLLGASILMEIPISMIILSHFLNDKFSRISNIVAGFIMTFVQIATLFSGKPTNYYLFFSIIEISATLYIIYLAWNWNKKELNLS